MADEILLKYKADFTQVDQEAQRFYATAQKVEDAGATAFNKVGDAAQRSAPKINSASKNIEQLNKNSASLSNSINQLSRELPAFTMNLNTGFLAISNNLPALFDAIKQITASNASLAAEGKKTQSVLGAVAGALFSWQTALSIGVTLLTAYGGKIVNFISGQEDSTEATKKGEEALKKYNEQLKIQRILQGTWDAATKDQIALLEKNTATQQKAVNAQGSVLKQKQEIIDLNEKEQQSIQELFKAYEVDYLDYLKLQQAEFDPAVRSAIGETGMKELKQRVNISGAMAQQLLEIQTGFNEQRNALEERQRKEFFEVIKTGNREIEQEEIDELKRQLQIREAAAENTMGLQVLIYDRELALLDKTTKAYKDKYAERQAFIIGVQYESDKRNAEAQEKYAKEQRHLAQEEDIWQNEAQKKRDKNAKDLQKKTIDDNYKEIERLRTIREKGLEDELTFSQTSFERRREILQEQLDLGYITQLEYTDANIELSNVETQAKIANYSAIASILGSVAEIVGQSTQAGKILGIAEATIATYVSAVLAYKSQLTIPTPDAPIRAKLAATSAIVAGLASIAAIAAVNVPKPKVSKLPSSTPQGSSLPKGYKDGVVDLQGPGSGTSDDIPAYLSKGESVIKASTTRHIKDDLTYANKSISDYNRHMEIKYAQPAVEEERRKNAEFTKNIVQSIMLQMNNRDVVKAINKNRPATSKDLAQLSESIVRQARIDKFEAKLKQPRK